MIDIKIDILYQAVDKNVTIELRRLEKKGEEFCFLSKFLEYDLEAKTLSIDFPSAPPGEENLKPDDRIVVNFIHKESPFSFNSMVQGLTAVELLSGQKSRVLLITLPESICGEERRDFLKVGTPPFDVDIKVITSQDIVKQLLGKKFKAASVNLSGGGIALEKKSEDLPFAVGDILELNLHLPPNDTIRIEGEIVNIYQFENTDRMIFGIKFIQRSLDKLCFKKSVNAITKYVMKRERELLTR